MRLWRFRRTLSSLCNKTNQIPFRRPSNISHLLQLCIGSKLLKQGKQVHQRMIAHGLWEEPFFITKLVQFYADSDEFVAAQYLFDQMPEPNVFAWTSMISFYSRHRLNGECAQIYREMKVNGVTPDNFVFPKVLRSCAQCERLELGIQVHRDVIVYGYDLYIPVLNSLIDMYAKCRDISGGRQVFDEMVERDLLSWNLLISGYALNDLPEVAVDVFSSLGENRIQPDVVTFNSVMDSYCRMGLCNEALEIFEQIEEPNIISWSTLIMGYSRAGRYNVALRIFRDMLNVGKVLPDLDSLSSSIVSCRHLNSLICGKEIHAYGIKMAKGARFYSSAGPALLALYAECGKIQHARSLFGLMDKSDIVTWNAMILGFIELGLGPMALECFNSLLETGTNGNEITVSTILPVCDLSSGKQLHCYAMKISYDLCVPVCNALIHMYSRSGFIQSALSVFFSMIIRDVVTWNSMIGGLSANGLGHAALELLWDLKQSGCVPNAVSFTSVLSACAHSGLVDEGLGLLESISRDFGQTPTMEHYACVVDMLARAGRLEEAVSFVNKMPVEPDKRVWGSILAACKAHQNLDIGELAAQNLASLEPERAGHYVALSNIYASAGRWNEAVEVRKPIENRGAVKPSGQSWIEG